MEKSGRPWGYKRAQRSSEVQAINSIAFAVVSTQEVSAEYQNPLWPSPDPSSINDRFHLNFLSPFVRHSASRTLLFQTLILWFSHYLSAPCISCISKYHHSSSNSCMVGDLSVITLGAPISSWQPNVSNSASCLSLKAFPFFPLSLLSFNLYYLMSRLLGGYILFICHASSPPSAEWHPRFPL